MSLMPHVTERKYLCDKSHERFRKEKSGRHKKNEKKKWTGSAEKRRMKMKGCEFPASLCERCLCEIKIRMC